MGDWRRVKIEGTCHTRDLLKLRNMLDPGRNYENFHCLVHTGGICGLPNWAGEQIDVIGNLAERDYGPEDVAEALATIAALCPTLSVLVHVGDHSESSTCVATVMAVNGDVSVGDPQIESIPEITSEQMQSNMMNQLTRPGW